MTLLGTYHVTKFAHVLTLHEHGSDVTLIEDVPTFAFAEYCNDRKNQMGLQLWNIYHFDKKQKQGLAAMK